MALLIRRSRATARRHVVERERLQSELDEARTRANETALERAALDAAVRVAQEAAESQRAALQQLSSELGDRLLQQHAGAFRETVAALERGASAQSDALRTAYEAVAAERTERLQADLRPIRDSLHHLSAAAAATDTRNAGALSQLTTLLEGLLTEGQAHREETRRLNAALRVSQVRGRFGEWTLQRMLEAAGLHENIHFLVQPAVRDERGPFRPDVVVLLPDERAVVIDSKVPLQHLLDAQHATAQDERNALLDRHAKALRTHVDQLSSKEYTTRIAALTPGRRVLDSTILFVPSDNVLEAARLRDAKLLEHAAQRRVHLTSPSSLLLVLSAVEQLWRQDRRERSADEIVKVGGELLERMGVVVGHVARLQHGVADCVAAYNALTASLETRLLPAARRLEALGVRQPTPLPDISEIDDAPRVLGPRAAALRRDSGTDESASSTDAGSASPLAA